MGLLELIGLKKKVDFRSLVEQGALIIDVRTSGEFKSGNYKGSVNIPLDKLNGKIKDIKKKNKPVIAVCRSGMRSGQATSILKQQGVDAYNGGPWNSLNYKLS